MSKVVPLTGQATVVMVVNGSPITIQVNGTDAPITAGNFVDLVDRGVYNGVSFHRVVREPTPFVVQGGDPQSKNPNIPASQLGTGGFTDPATNQERTIPLEIKPAGAAAPLYNQTFQSGGITGKPQLPHTVGAVAMARSQALDSASSQFYFALDNLPSLDGNYAVFGNVTSGFDVVNQIKQGDRVTSAKVTQGIIPSRVSAILSDVNRLNNFINFENGAELPVGFEQFSNTSETISLTPEFSQRTPGGARALNGSDRVSGSVVSDVASGGGGEDTMSGEAGADYFAGGEEDDWIIGGADSDILNGNKGADRIDGGGGDDFLRGGRGKDTITGGDGNDCLVGDFGVDVLTGGSGADTFILRAETAATAGNFAAADRAVDFNAEEGDRIVIVGALQKSDITFTIFGSDSQLELANGFILGRVQNSMQSSVSAATFTVDSSDAAMSIG